MRSWKIIRSIYRMHNYNSESTENFLITGHQARPADACASFSESGMQLKSRYAQFIGLVLPSAHLNEERTTQKA